MGIILVQPQLWEIMEKIHKGKLNKLMVVSLLQQVVRAGTGEMCSTYQVLLKI